MTATTPTLLDWLVAIGTIASPLVSAIAVLIAMIVTRQTLEAQRDLQRPILIITEEESHLIHITPGGTINLDSGAQNIAIKNVGSGPARRIQGVIFGQENLDPHLSDRHLWCNVAKVLATQQESPENVFSKEELGPSLALLRGSTNIIEPKRFLFWTRKQYSLWVPIGETAPVRLVLTYHDVYGQTHASIYEYTQHLSWEPIDFIKKVENDLEQLNRRDSKIPTPLPVQQ